ncbi:LytTR family DNA-binding domain-containing protein [Limibacter armeniacum]|uniref:LytR/AlgR family response regulator transcription factor n=1 Tax=Limibacter armeniacum TaxID=466084 RepID=UPI002FE4FD46
MNVLIIEDEPLAQEEMARLLKRCNESLEIIDYLDSVEEAVEWFLSNDKPDLVFMDIQLSDGLSFEIFSQVNVDCPVIFTTAYDEYAIRAFKVNSVDYLLKPIEEEALKSALKKHEQLLEVYGSQSGLTVGQLSEIINIPRQGSYKERFVVTLGDRINFVETERIAYFFADNNTVYLIMDEGKKFVLNYKLEQLEKMLNPKFFFRLNRTYICNIKAIKEVHKYFNSRLLVMLNPDVKDHEVLVSRARVPEFLKWLEGDLK